MYSYCLSSFLSGSNLGVILLAAAALPALVAGDMLVEVFQNGTDVVVQASGSLNTAGLAPFEGSCGPSFGAISSNLVCVGPSGFLDCYAITGPSDLSGGPVAAFPAQSSTPGVTSALFPVVDSACVSQGYTSGGPLNGTSVYLDTTLEALNFTEAVDLTWTFDGSPSDQTAHFVVLGPTTAAPVVAPTMAPTTMAPVVVSPTPTDNKCYVDHDYYGASSKTYDDSKFLRGGEEYDLGEICPHASYELKVCCLVNDGDDAAACVTCDECAINEAVNDGCCAWEWWDDEDKNGDDRHSRRNLNGVYYGGCIHQYEDKNYQCCKCEEFYHCAGPEEDCMTVCMANSP